MTELNKFVRIKESGRRSLTSDRREYMGIEQLKFKDEDGDRPVGLEVVISVVENGYLVESEGERRVYLNKKPLLDFLKEYL